MARCYQFTFKRYLEWIVEMRSVVILIVVATCFARAQCLEQNQTCNELLLQEIEQLKLNQQTLMQLVSKLVDKEDKPQRNLSSIIFAADHQWVSWSPESKIPHRSLIAGFNRNYDAVYVGRVFYREADWVATASPADKKCFIAADDEESDFDRCEILTGSGFAWVPITSNSTLPDNAFPCGRKFEGGEQQYIGRVKHVYNPEDPDNYRKTPGTINPNSGRLSIVFEARTYEYHEYEVLVKN